ncbi:hypothetical protein FF011L_04950 [Roseimaritima multifibrata]|uniref:Uncharacterized protein n=1 Tax=Roseimaritima multifibrata TaxID=1930274 RepID=A0A517MA44_9BACT|nr:hypothetical protein [Roseimaritima multifibrata]QDS91760.1 hypothetical protein FF011L_04950 [Roseimaritima multifibrata]
MKHLLATCVLCTGLLGLIGCNQTASEPAAQTPTADSADTPEVTEPATDETAEKTTVDTSKEKPATEESKP